MNPPPRFARTLALIYGVGLPLLETIRRWGQLTDDPRSFYWPGLLDDYLIGGMLLAALLRWRSNPIAGRRWLAAAWGLTCGMGYASFFGNLRDIHTADPSGINHVIIVAVIGVGWLLAIVAMIQTIENA